MDRLDEIRDDIAAFADDDEAVIIEDDGTIMFLREGHDVLCQLRVTPDERMLIEIDGQVITYREFLVRYLGHLDVLAERIILKRPQVPAFVDGPALSESISEGKASGTAVELLSSQCTRVPPFATRLVFITADAGQGKTWLLRQYQALSAERFLQNKSPFLFFHLDLQGRQLLRLSEALMGDLGDLRVTGLWMPAIIRLLRRRALVLAIDGFDELAAEQGGTEALGALAMLVRQMESRGVIVAASRRTFFDTEDYLRRAGLFRRNMRSACEFNQISLLKWRKREGVSFLSSTEYDGNSFPDPLQTYQEIVAELGGSEDHPMVSRPFLLSHIARILLRYGTSVPDLVRPLASPRSGVAEVVQAFVAREVQEKWVYRDTGEPYLTIEQHMRLLSDVAEEMYKAQRDRLDLDIIQAITTLLLEEWGVDASRQQQVIEMVGMHVLLTVPVDGDATQRSFDHPEFRDYFIAHSLKNHLERAAEGQPASNLSQFLSVAPLSDSTARYVGAMLDLTPEFAHKLVGALSTIVRREWKPTYLQTNIGTLLPPILDGLDFSAVVEFSGPAVLSSLILEATQLSNVKFLNCTLVNASLAGVVWKNVTFEHCDLGELTIDGRAKFNGVSFRHCKLEGLRLVVQTGDVIREYAPLRVRATLGEVGIRVMDELPQEAGVTLNLNELRLYRHVRKLLNMFYRTTVVTTDVLRGRFSRQDYQTVLNEVIPLMVRHGILEERQWRGRGQAHIWQLRRGIEEVLAAEDSSQDASLISFWKEVKAK